MLRRLEAWADSIAYPVGPFRPDAGYTGAKPPVAQDLVDPPLAGPETQRRCVELILAAAARLARIKPAPLAASRVVAVVPFPALFHSAVDVFFDEAYWAAFTRRHSNDQTWTPLPSGQSLAQQLGIGVPPGFREHGYHCLYRDDTFDQMVIHEDCWLFSEVLPGDGD